VPWALSYNIGLKLTYPLLLCFTEFSVILLLARGDNFLMMTGDNLFSPHYFYSWVADYSLKDARSFYKSSSGDYIIYFFFFSEIR
jgi:hypothetical protein